MSILKKWLYRITRTGQRPSISRECLSAIVKARSICGPYTPETSMQSYARDFLRKYQDGDFRCKFGSPTMSISELQALGDAAGW